jgi:hypothetical protein
MVVVEGSFAVAVSISHTLMHGRFQHQLRTLRPSGCMFGQSHVIQSRYLGF